MTKLLIPEQPLLILPQLAAKIGLNEAIFIQQAHYWLNYSQHTYENKRWIYNSYPSWKKQFPFWSIDTIKRTIAGLEKLGIIISGNFNKSKMDKTKWYTIEYTKIPDFTQDTELTIGANCTHRESNLHSPIPETTTEIIDYKIIDYSVASQRKKRRDEKCLEGILLPRRDLLQEFTKDEYVQTFLEMFSEYKKQKHPPLRNEQKKRIVLLLHDMADEYVDTIEDYRKMVKNYFLSTLEGNDNGKCNYSLLHFSAPKIFLYTVFDYQGGFYYKDIEDMADDVEARVNQELSNI